MKKSIIAFISFISCFAITSVFASSLRLFYDGQVHDYYGSTYKLIINDKQVQTSVEPIIFNDYTLVPVREVFEAFGATVKYLDDTKEIHVYYGDSSIKLQINNNKAYINSKKTSIPGGITPKLIALAGENNAKTMVPLRFISEGFGFKVDFNGDKGVISITNQSYTTPLILNKVQSSVKNNITTIDVSCDNAIKSMTSPQLTSSGVMYIDINNSKYSVANSVEISSSSVQRVRFGTSDGKTRIAVDLADYKKYNAELINDGKTVHITVEGNESVTSSGENTVSPEDIIYITDYKVSESSDKTVIEITADKKMQSVSSAKLTSSKVLYIDIPNCKYRLPNTIDISTEAVSDLRFGTTSDFKTRISLDLANYKSYKSELTNSNKTIKITVTTKASSSDTEYQRPETNINNGKKTVVIDAGHGGSDPGAVKTHDEITYQEKDINLSIAKKVRDILEKNNINVVMTREKDTYPSLTDRSDIANECKAVIFTSIHSNSATTDTPTGFEVYYSNTNNSDETGLTSKELATAVNKAIDKQMDSKNRGVKTAEHVVTKTCYMPAILVEVGFVSTKEEAELMVTDEFQSKFAKGIADGILSVIQKANPLEGKPKRILEAEEKASTNTDNSDNDKSSDH